MEEILKKIDVEIANSKPFAESPKEVNERLQCYVNGLQKAKEIIQSEQKTNGWIPVSERLPENEGYYLVSLKHLESADMDVDLFHHDNEEGFWFHDNMQKRWWKVVAWQPLPEPYKEESH